MNFNIRGLAMRQQAQTCERDRERLENYFFSNEPLHDPAVLSCDSDLVQRSFRPVHLVVHQICK